MTSTTKKLIVSPAPHIHNGDSIERNMYGALLALTPAWVASLFFFGLGALIVTLVSIAACLVFEYLLQRFLLKGRPSLGDGSALVTGALLAFNLPSNLPLWIILIGALAAIGIGKMSFGGLGNNIFNPALVGRVFLLISFPVQMTSWPEPGHFFPLHYTDAVSGATTLALIKSHFGQWPSYAELLTGNRGGSLGEVSAIALLIGGGYLLWKKIITWHIPVSILAAVAAVTGILYGVDPGQYASPGIHLLSGGLLLGAFFMATDYVTSPMTPKGMILYGTGIGIITALIRLFGAYPEGVSFAILIMNALTPLINKYIQPKRFGETPKK
jgi:electron transport complex protein RnfD